VIRMCHSIKIHKEKKLAQITAEGKVNILELKEIFLETIEHEDWLPGFNMLCDYSNIEDFDVTTGDMEDITEWQSSIDALIGAGRCAVVGCKDSVYGMSRMWEIISSERSQQICVFRQMNDAVIWLDNIVEE
jgi:hypothetical protein